MTRRRTLQIAVLVGAVLVLSGCSVSVQHEGSAVRNADAFLADADAAFLDAVAGLPEDIAVRADDAKCFFEDTGGGEVGDRLFCGPIRQLGYEDPWLSMSFTAKVGRDDSVRLDDPVPGPYATPKGALLRAGQQPSDPDAVAAPRGPQTDQKDFAVLLPWGEVPSVKISELDDPALLAAPAATVTIDAEATLPLIPDAALSVLRGDEASRENESSFWRPAEGQTFTAWRVRVGDPVEMGPGHRGLFGTSREDRDPSLSLAVDAEGTRLVVASRGGGLSAKDGVARVECGSLPCNRPAGGDYLLVVSAPSDGTPRLIASTDGQEESVSLDGGEVKSEHSTAAYDGRTARMQTSAVWASKAFEVVSREEAGTYGSPQSITYGGDVPAVFRTPFEARRGWAPAGKVWLVVPTENITVSSSGWGMEVRRDRVASWTAQFGEEAINAEPEIGASDNTVFAVGQDVTDITITFQPRGSIEYSRIGSNLVKEFVAPEPFTVEVSFK
ncbi:MULTISPECIES: hypothetical protein [unclassified Microbacterium]|uniref:hypothetical protein n=1 Tax=unclassified Microbacterium TaxID=2609290 RepID=UPI0030102069